MNNLIEKLSSLRSQFNLFDENEREAYHALSDAIKEISERPEIVRCKECKWKQGSECVRFAEVRPFPDDFCSRAERKTDG